MPLSPLSPAHGVFHSVGFIVSMIFLLRNLHAAMQKAFIYPCATELSVCPACLKSCGCSILHDWGSVSM